MIESIPRSIRIDKEGIWFYGDDEIFRKEIILLFYDNLKQDHSGRYVIELGHEKCYVEVEDAPFIVKSVSRDKTADGNDEAIHLHLSDGKNEPLEPNTLRIGNGNVLYCSVRNRRFAARFSRAAYYQIVNFVEYNDETEEYFIALNGNTYRIHSTTENPVLS
jgi:uncharacterized protein